jgi:hypothetical protein
MTPETAVVIAQLREVRARIRAARAELEPHGFLPRPPQEDRRLLFDWCTRGWSHSGCPGHGKSLGRPMLFCHCTICNHQHPEE